MRVGFQFKKDGLVLRGDRLGWALDQYDEWLFGRPGSFYWLIYFLEHRWPFSVIFAASRKSSLKRVSKSLKPIMSDYRSVQLYALLNARRIGTEPLGEAEAVSLLKSSWTPLLTHRFGQIKGVDLASKLWKSMLLELERAGRPSVTFPPDAKAVFMLVQFAHELPARHRAVLVNRISLKCDPKSQRVSSGDAGYEGVDKALKKLNKVMRSRRCRPVIADMSDGVFTPTFLDDKERYFRQVLAWLG